VSETRISIPFDGQLQVSQQLVMTMKTACVAVGATVVIALGIASCGESRKQTTPQSPTEPTPVTAVLARVELLAPGSIAPGGSAQLTANAVKSDNSVEDVTGQAHGFPRTAGWSR
jgi:hypothetical protein